YIKFLNSWGTDWGEVGYGYIGEDYFTTGNIFSAWTLTDMPNPIIGDLTMLKLIKESEFASDIYAVSGGYRYWVMDPNTLNSGISIWGDWSSIKVEDPRQYQYGGALFIAKPDDKIK
ncbi:MAG: hypothetical protein AABY22_00520, partial [Nanoarchaeota archaeon]